MLCSALWKSARHVRRRFARDERGQVIVIFTLALPVVMGGMAGAIDVTTWYGAQARLQRAADGAALATARELQISTANPALIARTGEDYVRSLLKQDGPEPSKIKISPSSSAAASGTALQTVAKVGNYNTVRVDVAAAVSPIFSRIFSDSFTTVAVSATARLSPGPPICAIGLDPRTAGTLHFEKNARLTADACAIQANSVDRRGLQAESGAVVKAASICTAGGYSGTSSNYSPTPTTDCPPILDPLAGRPPPVVGACTFTNRIIEKDSVSLQPGVYCGGLKVSKKATVTLAPGGLYVFKDGVLIVEKKSSFTGQNVSLYFAGDKSGLLFDKDSTISLTAPASGPMAGILMSEDRTVVNPVSLPLPTDILAPVLPPVLPLGAPKMREYRIISDNARMLLGTIYLPSGRLMIDAGKPVADQSAFTVIVAQRLDLFDGPNLYLNAGYTTTNIPVPVGVGPVGGTVSLTN